MDRQGVHVVDLGRSAPKVIGAGQTPRTFTLFFPAKKNPLTPSLSTAYLRPFLSKLVEVSQSVQSMAQADDERAVQEATEGVEQLTPPKLDRLKERLALGVGAEVEAASSRESTDGEVAILANAINQLALGASFFPFFP